jgi:flagellar hook-associated protein FlgK
VFNSFTTALQALQTSPDDPSARTTVLRRASARSAPQRHGIGRRAAHRPLDSVAKANEAMQRIADINSSSGPRPPMMPDGDLATSDQYIDQLRD